MYYMCRPCKSWKKMKTCCLLFSPLFSASHEILVFASTVSHIMQDVRTHQLLISLRHSGTYAAVASCWVFKTLFFWIFLALMRSVRKIKSPWRTWSRSQEPPTFPPMTHTQANLAQPPLFVNGAGPPFQDKGPLPGSVNPTLLSPLLSQTCWWVFISGCEKENRHSVSFFSPSPVWLNFNELVEQPQ